MRGVERPGCVCGVGGVSCSLSRDPERAARGSRGVKSSVTPGETLRRRPNDVHRPNWILTFCTRGLNGFCLLYLRCRPRLRFFNPFALFDAFGGIVKCSCYQGYRLFVHLMRRFLLVCCRMQLQMLELKTVVVSSSEFSCFVMLLLKLYHK